MKRRQDNFNVDRLAIGHSVFPFYHHLPRNISDQFSFTMFHLLDAEPCFQNVPPPAFDRMSLQEYVEYRNALLQKQYFFANEKALLDLLAETLQDVFSGLAGQLPEIGSSSPFTIPMIYALAEPKMLVQRLIGTMNRDELQERGILRPYARTLYQNLCRVSGKEEDNKKPWKLPGDSPLPLNEIVEQYLRDTPFYDLLMTPVPLKLTNEDRFSHMHVIGGTGAGKTTLIESLILHDIASENPPAIVLIDPHSDLVRKLVGADIGIKDRLILIDPRDIAHPPAINVFAVDQGRLDGYDEATREQVTAGVIQTFDYLFSSLFDLDLSGKQSVFFRYSVRLLLSLPETMGRNATIIDLLNLMADHKPYQEAIDKLPPIQRDFFEKDFATSTFKPTREQIRYRLQAIIENPTMARIFTSPETRVDLFSALNEGKIILIDTAKDFLKDNSAVFGQLFISLILQAVLERAVIPEGKRRPAFVYIDESASFFSSNIDDLLTEARKYKCGLVLAHQYLDQASGSLRASLHANTNIKFASGLSASDARTMAPEMRTTADFIMTQPKLQFACHIRNVTPQAVSIPVEPVAAGPALSDEEFRSLIERNRERVSSPRQPPRHTEESVKVHQKPEPSEDISDQW
ncbi:MAG: DUF87 domain-containing protein [Burkholderiales bacterium]